MVDRVLANPKITVCWDHVVDEVLDVSARTVTGVRLRQVRTGKITERPLQGLFVAIGHTPNTGLFKGLLALDDEGYLVARECRTNVRGVFAAGDVQDRRYRQAITAAGSGCMAALEAERYLGTFLS
jgi:thioredoxin reductase (NADPH)